MTYFTPGDNTQLDLALDIVTPHTPQKLGTIQREESAKVIAYLQRMGRHRTFLLLHRYGSDELIRLMWESGSITGGHRLKFTTRVDEIFSELNDSAHMTR